jgi:hypothetical protein
MRKALNIAFFLGVIVFVVILYFRLHEGKQAPSREALVANTQAAIPAPRLALVTSPLDAGPDARTPIAPRTDEQHLLKQIRALVKSDPPKAESLAREARQRFGDSPESDERDALLVDALINQQRIGAARSETYYYFDHHPAGRYAEHLFTMTGVHPTPSGPRR